MYVSLSLGWASSDGKMMNILFTDSIKTNNNKTKQNKKNEL